jgi:hypothetical protein
MMDVVGRADDRRGAPRIASGVGVRSSWTGAAFASFLGRWATPGRRGCGRDGGDDYELLFTGRERARGMQAGGAWAAADPIGGCEAGAGLPWSMRAARLPLPERLGYEHRAG